MEELEYYGGFGALTEAVTLNAAMNGVRIQKITSNLKSLDTTEVPELVEKFYYTGLLANIIMFF